MSGKNMFSKLLLLAGGCVSLGASSFASAGVEVYRDGDKSVELGARLQLQYHRTDPDVGASEDEWFFRRLRPYIQGTVTSDWEGKFQFDLG
ncbi:MAG: hypothetical protein O2780_20915, partial [Proteobacteria bacterium]|nr:hypothetical protein [Pseudomonadota bacterium]